MIFLYYGLLVISSLQRITSASLVPTCDGGYGRPSAIACKELLQDLRDRRIASNVENRFMSVPPAQGQRPDFVDADAWERRITLPNIHAEGTDTLIHICILRLYSQLTISRVGKRKLQLGSSLHPHVG